MTSMRPDPAPIPGSWNQFPISDRPVDVVRERHGATTRPVANVGKTIQIHGEIRGEEDLIIEGQVDGNVLLAEHRLTIGAGGEVRADVKARSILVSGTVTGNVAAEDRVEITASGRIEGDIRAPRLAIHDGARIKGSIDTSPLPQPKVQGKEQATGKRESPREATAKAAGMSGEP